MSDAVTFKTDRARAIVASVAGNLIEWYDFTVYSFVAVIIGNHFFPSDRADLSLLTTYAVFGIGFVARPAWRRAHREIG